MGFTILSFSFVRDSAHEQEKDNTEESIRFTGPRTVDLGDHSFCYCSRGIRDLFVSRSACIRRSPNDPTQHGCAIRRIQLEPAVSTFSPVSDLHLELYVERSGCLELSPG